MPIYVVGLKDGYRGDVLEDQLTQQGLTFRRHVAFDARHLGDAELNELADQTAAGVLRHRPLTSGEIGCALSHRAVHEIISRDDSEWALVLEDDARLVNKSLGALLVSLADTLKAQQPCVVSLFADVDYLVADGSSTESLPEFPQHVLLRAFFAPTYTSAYVINRAAAQLSSAQSGKIDFVADWPPSWACRTNFRAVFSVGRVGAG